MGTGRVVLTAAWCCNTGHLQPQYRHPSTRTEGCYWFAGMHKYFTMPMASEMRSSIVGDVVFCHAWTEVCTRTETRHALSTETTI